MGQNLCQNLNTFSPAIEHQNQNTSKWFILIISDKKKKSNLTIVILLLEIQNSGQNQIQAMIIYGEEILNLKLGYFAWTKSEYLTAFCQAQITNYKF